MSDIISNTDWAEEWRKRDQKRKEPADAAEWNRRSRDYGTASGHSNYTKRFIELMDLQPGETILDVGSGPGTLAIPLAEAGHSVTALDFSEGMLGVLERRAKEQGVEVQTILGSWNDDWSKLDMQQHDVVIASRSTMVADLWDALDKLTAYARSRVCMTLIASRSPRTDDILLKSLDKHYSGGVDYLYALLMLHKKGYAPELRQIISKKYDRYESPEVAVEQSLRYFTDPQPSDREAVEAYLKDHLVYDPEASEVRPYRKDYLREVRWAFVTWDVRQKY